MSLETERLILRPPGPEDEAAIVGYYMSDRRGGAHRALDHRQAWSAFAGLLGHWAIRGFGRFTIILRRTGAAIGLVGPWYPGTWPEPEMAWALFSDRDEGRGLAAEAARICLAHAFDDLGWTTAVSYIWPENTRSRALATHLGASQDATAPIVDDQHLTYRHVRPGSSS